MFGAKSSLSYAKQDIIPKQRRSSVSDQILVMIRLKALSELSQDHLSVVLNRVRIDGFRSFNGQSSRVVVCRACNGDRNSTSLGTSPQVRERSEILDE